MDTRTLRTLILATALAYLSLAAARMVSRRTYRSVPGYSAWMLSDALIGIGVMFLALREGPISLGASLFGSYVFIIGGAELRYRGVRQFCGLSAPSLLSLLPYFIVLSTRLVPSPTVRAGLFDLTLTYVGTRTAWLLLRDHRILGVVAALTAVVSLIQAIILMTQPVVGNVFFADPWFLAGMSCLSIVWSFASLGWASRWLETRGALVDESPIPTVVMSLDGVFEHANRKFVETMGFKLDDLASDARSVWHHVVELAKTNPAEQSQGEIVVELHKGSPQTLELHARRVDDRMLMMLVDVTALKAAARARDEMVVEVSHDLKSPLNAMKLCIGLLERNAADAKVASLASSFRRSVSTMEQLVRQLLEAAILESGRLQLNLATTDVGALASSVVEAMRPLATSHSTDIVCDVPPVAMVCDSERLTRALSNLIENAIKFTKNGTIRVGAEKNLGETLISVTDTGCGIAPDTLPHIFERYFTTSRGHHGAGLGLHIAKGFIEAHGGRIWATSELGKGTTFWFTLPHSTS
jgi:signal transduction histidine kinase